MRSIVVLLLLVVFFLAGTLFGINRGDLALIGSDKDEQVQSIEVEVGDEPEEQKPEELVENVVEEVDTTYVMNMEEPVNFTQKTASFLEAGVKVFYDAVVHILYQISQLFY
ncbi:hypothetical protein GMD78_01475 [Ornithinibacillus sp. L9]|uniref:Uncharacterized protein n=1 Tax=Ornithinibacillus caprae TaxID=2678566 RepID=A0A6N8FBZ1_9BACI|nr:hypothetical protein [Ornithinibacillus caprae]MUK87073.1 hypothetical protein [Ornithinibacillus caprae]